MYLNYFVLNLFVDNQGHLGAEGELDEESSMSVSEKNWFVTGFMGCKGMSCTWRREWRHFY